MDGALGAHIWEVGQPQGVHDAPGVVGLVSRELRADRASDIASRSIGTDHVLGTHDPFEAFVVLAAADQGDLNRVLLSFFYGKFLEVPAVVGHRAGRRVRRELGKVVDDARLVDHQVREFADTGGIIWGAIGADDAFRVLSIGIPEGRFLDDVRLGSYLLCEPERLESFYGA